MEVIHSISRPEKVFDTTGSRPALILCDDLDFYVCKYNRFPGSESKKLFHEFLAGSFARIWNLSIPEFKLVWVNPHHIYDCKDLQPHFFTTPCFGSKYNRKFSEVDEFYGERIASIKKHFGYRNEFLKIAFFDIWLANEDRNFNNYNLLIDIGNKNRFVPIDHDAIFNTGNLDKGLLLLSDNETLISTDLTKQLFSSKELCDRNNIEKIKNESYICILECRRQLKNLITDNPAEWNINTTDYQNLLEMNLFNEKWIKDCLEHFTMLIQLEAQR